jgi:hypothetical protein
MRRALSLLLWVFLSDHGQCFVSLPRHATIATNGSADKIAPAAATAPPGAAAAAEEWRERAAKLRQEIQDYETLRNKNEDVNATTTERPDAMVVAPERIEDSTWQMTYRFILGDDNDNGNDDTNKERESFGGTVNMKFRSDGYTDLLSQKSSGDRGATIVKAWGWDLEAGAEKDDNDKEYLLFSMDFEFPENDKKTKNRPRQRLYFQARHRSTAGCVDLAEGTITVKTDVLPKSSRWALFPTAGILAQFRYAGNFVAKPVRG